LETHGTLFHGKQAAVELIVRVLACLAEGLGIRATARVFEVAPNTVLQWLVEAAEQLRAFSAYFLCELHLEQLQLDEVYAVLRACKAGESSDAEAITRLERSPYSTIIAPVTAYYQRSCVETYSKSIHLTAFLHDSWRRCGDGSVSSTGSAVWPAGLW
jgi:hypothetical protein